MNKENPYILTKNCWGDIVNVKKGKEPGLFMMWFDQKEDGSSIHFLFDQKQMDHLADRLEKAIQKAKTMNEGDDYDLVDEQVDIFIDKLFANMSTFEFTYSNSLIKPIFTDSQVKEFVKALRKLSKRFGHTVSSQIKTNKINEAKRAIEEDQSWNPKKKTWNSLFRSISKGLNKAGGCNNKLKFTDQFCEKYKIDRDIFSENHHQGCDCEILMNIKDRLVDSEDVI